MKNMISSIALFLLGMSISYACTDFRLQATDGTVLISRSMEFAMDMKSNLISSPQEKEFNSTAPNGKPGLSWNAKYGYVFLDGLDLGVPVDGMNEVGLSLEALLFPGEAEYQTVPGGREQQALSYLSFGDWVLGNFKTVDEVREALKDIYLFEEKLPQLNDTVFPLHYSIFD
ncbi:MAG: linear amide C-N hydrolase, partial [Gammaproteobacteria bacterium]